MAKSNEELIQQADDAMRDLTSSGGLLTEEQSRRFAQYLEDNEDMLSKCRVVHFFPWYIRIWRKVSGWFAPLLRRTTCKLGWHAWEPAVNGRWCRLCGALVILVRDRG